MAKLLVHESAGIREFDLVDAEIHIGRELDNSLRLADPSISRHHCVVRRTATGYEIQDLQSSNGVLLNGSRVQTSPMRDGDRITLGQIQLSFSDPQAEIAATVAVQRDTVPEPPLGTVRMSAEQMSAVHAAGSPEPGATAPLAAPTFTPSPAPPMAEPPMETLDVPRPTPPPPPPAPRPEIPQAPGFGQFTNPGTPTMSQNPAPSFLQPYLPPVPDDAQPTGERGELGPRFLAALIDAVPSIVIAIGFWFIQFVLVFIPVLGCIAGCALTLVHMALQLAYWFYWVPSCVAKHGASIGKKMQHMRVVPLGSPTGRLTLGSAILRQLGNFGPLALVNLIILVVKGDERIGLTDMFAKSEVIKVDR